MSTIGVLGAGTWAIALARLLANSGHEVMVWSAVSSEIDELSANRKQRNLPGVIIPDSVRFTKDICELCQGKDIVIFAVPSIYVRTVAKVAAPHILQNQIIVDVAKGIEEGTLYTMTQVIRDEIHSVQYVVALSGPSHAEEVARDIPTTIVSACANMIIAEKVQDVFMNKVLRVYTNFDVEGVELCGAFKNIIALGAGIAAGLGYGDNTKAAIITRGMAEITRLGIAMGCSEQTFNGLAGIGDLIVTATSNHSRNNKCGYLIGKGKKVSEAIQEIGMVVEGINAIPAAIQLSKRYKIELPIISAVNDIINKEKEPKSVVDDLMLRERKSECYSLGFEQEIIQSKRGASMKRVITYGTYDLLHYGHINLLRRAKALGDYLIVALSSDEFNYNMKHKKTYFTYDQRKQLLESVRYVDLVIPEDNWEQKVNDMHEYHIDTFVIGDDWEGKFDYLKDEGVNVVYLPRTPEISSSQMKKELHDSDEVGESILNHDDLDI